MRNLSAATQVILPKGGEHIKVILLEPPRTAHVVHGENGEERKIFIEKIKKIHIAFVINVDFL